MKRILALAALLVFAGSAYGQANNIRNKPAIDNPPGDYLLYVIAPSGASADYNTPVDSLFDARIGVEDSLEARLTDVTNVFTNNDLDFVGPSQFDETANYTLTGLWDFSTGTWRVSNSGSLPGTCGVGDGYQLTSATTGQQWYLCESANNWVLQGGGAHASTHSDGGSDEVNVEDLATTCADGEVVKGSAGGLVCGADNTGSSGAVLDLGDDGSNESSSITEIATINDTNTIATEGIADQLLFNMGNNWVEADSVQFFKARTAAPTIAGKVVWDNTNKEIEVGDGASTVKFLPAVVTVDENFCTYESSNNGIDCGTTQNAGTDITTDLEEETHASEHSDGAADEITAENLATSCTNGQILEASAGGWVCAADDTGTGTPLILDLGNDDSNESGDLAAIETTGDVNSIFTEPDADSLLINVGNNWPTADAADALSANAANCAAGSGAGGVDASGAAEDCTDYLENVVEDTTPQLGGTLDAQGNNISNGATVTFQTGVTGGSLRTGTSSADLFVLAGYDVDGASYQTLLSVNADNNPFAEAVADRWRFIDFADGTKRALFDFSSLTTATTRTYTFPDVTGEIEMDTHASEHSDGAADQIQVEDLSTTCANGEVVKGSAGGLVCGTDNTGPGVALDLADDASNESANITEIATTNDTNNIFTEPASDKLLIDAAQNWPTADAAVALSANGANCSAGNYPLGVDASGAAESCTADDDVPESGDFGNAADLESTGALSTNTVDSTHIVNGSILTGDMGNSDFGDFTCDGNNAGCSLDSGTVDAAEVATDAIGTAELDDDANSPTAGLAVVVETGAASFDYVDMIEETELDAFSKLQSQVADKTLINEEDAVVFDANVSYNGGQVWTEPNSVTASTESGDWTPNMDDGNEFSITVDQALTIQDPTNIQAGGIYNFLFTQDGTGGYALTRGGTDFPDTLIINTNANAKTYLTCQSHTDGGPFSRCWIDYPTVAHCVAASDETTALTTGTAKVTFRMPFPMQLSVIRGSLTSNDRTGGTLTVDVHDSGTTVMATTKLTIDGGELTSEDAATDEVITDTQLADDAQITIDIDALGTGGTSEAGLKVCLKGLQL